MMSCCGSTKTISFSCRSRTIQGITPTSSNRAARPTPRIKQARDDHQGLGQVHPVGAGVAAAERATPRPALAPELRADLEREPPGGAVIPAHRRWVVLALGPPQPQPPGPRQPLDQGRLLLAEHEPARPHRVDPAATGRGAITRRRDGVRRFQQGQDVLILGVVLRLRRRRRVPPGFQRPPVAAGATLPPCQVDDHLVLVQGRRHVEDVDQEPLGVAVDRLGPGHPPELSLLTPAAPGRGRAAPRLAVLPRTARPRGLGQPWGSGPRTARARPPAARPGWSPTAAAGR